jgi:hypothetical protein
VICAFVINTARQAATADGAAVLSLTIVSELHERPDAYLEAVAAALRATLVAHLVGAYVHGSIALGDYDAERSDVDVLAVSRRSLSDAEKKAIAEQLTALPCPAVGGLEFHLVARAALSADIDAPAFELHVSTEPEQPSTVVDGSGRPGDSDLPMHFAVLKAHGLRVGAGPDARELFPRVGRATLLRAFAAELRWALDHASPAYRVLNACRAWRFHEEDRLGSKVEGAEWALRRNEEDRSVIDAALRHRRRLSDNQPDSEAADAFVAKMMNVTTPRPDRRRNDRKPPHCGGFP